MRPVLRSLLAEISPNWLTAARLRRRKGSLEPLDPSVSQAKPPASGKPAGRKSQTACYVPPQPRSRDIASNM